MNKKYNIYIIYSYNVKIKIPKISLYNNINKQINIEIKNINKKY